MDAIKRALLEKQCQTLRADLKSWEHRWSSEHDGAKPSREAIKGTPDIAKKYKEYNRLRDVLSGKISDESPPKRKAPEPAQTPVKRTRYYKTASDAATEPPPFTILSTPSADRTAPSPAAPTSIGPTPHRDGKVLGLFAFLDESAHTTPSKKTATPSNIQQTPQKTAGREGEDTEGFKLGRTPRSGSKRRHADAMVTPLKAADGNAQKVLPRTPVSVSKLQFGTPSFLRRRPMPAVEEADEYASPEKLRRTSRRPFARGLSAIVANLRKVEETQFDDDEEAMREMEGAGMPPEGFSARPAAVPVAVREDSLAAAADAAVVIAPESPPAVRLLGGFDDEGEHDDAVAETQMDRGREMRVYKKKNPKRTTRKVNMKPTFIRRPAAEVADAFLDDDDDDGEDGPVPETQVDPTAADGATDGEEEYKVGGAAAKQVSKGQKPKGAAGDGKDGEGTVRKVAKKVNELAHANFRRLKLRGRGAGGGPGVGSRFRRRR